MRFDAVLFDLDGTLVDNMAFHLRAWEQLCAEHALVVAAERFEREFSGMRNVDIVPLVFGREMGRDEIERISEQKEATYRKIYAPHMKPLDGLVSLLERLAERGLRCAIGSAGPAKNRALVLDGLGLRKYFPAVIGAEHVSRGKPAPDLFLGAAAALGVPPDRCLVFEDAVQGVTAGIAAGAQVAGITTMTAEQALREAGARWVVRDYTQLPRDLEEALFARAC